MALLKYSVAIGQRRDAINKNHKAFRRLLNRLVEEHAGEYALLRDANIVSYYPTAAEALRDAKKRYPHDVRYSVEKVQKEPAYMGMYADVAVSSKS